MNDFRFDLHLNLTFSFLQDKDEEVVHSNANSLVEESFNIPVSWFLQSIYARMS